MAQTYRQLNKLIGILTGIGLISFGFVFAAQAQCLGGSGTDNCQGDGNGNTISVIGPTTADIDTAAGDDNVLIFGTGVVNDDLNTGDGSDAILNVGTVNGDVNMGDDTNLLLNANTVGGNVTGGSGVDGVVNTGSIGGNVETGGGVDEVDNDGTIGGNVNLGDGVDILDNSGSIDGNVASGDGGGLTTNDGDIGGNVTGGTGADGVVNNGTIDGNVETGDGVDGVVNRGTIGGNVDTGAGDDLVNNIEGGAVTGNVDLGAGDDEFNTTGPVNGSIDGGEGDDELFIDLETDPLSPEVAGRIRSQAASGGTFTVDGVTYTWSNFEELRILLEENAGTGFQMDGRINFLDLWAPVAIYPVGENYHIYAINEETSEGIFALAVSFAEANAAGAGQLASTTHPITGNPIILTILSNGDLLVSAVAIDGKTYQGQWSVGLFNFERLRS